MDERSAMFDQGGLKFACELGVWHLPRAESRGLFISILIN